MPSTVNSKTIGIPRFLAWGVTRSLSSRTTTLNAAADVRGGPELNVRNMEIIVMRRIAWLSGGGVIVLLIGAAMGAALPAGGPGNGRAAGFLGRFRCGRAAEVRAKLNLTDAQVASIRGVLKAHKAEIAQAVKPIVSDRRALADLVRAESTDETAIRAAAEQLGKAVGDGAVLAAKVRKEIRPILTPEQRKQLDDMRAEGRESVDTWLTGLGQQPESD
jgi:Spy/CpxP family protein refolding chaperone